MSTTEIDSLLAPASAQQEQADFWYRRNVFGEQQQTTLPILERVARQRLESLMKSNFDEISAMSLCDDNVSHHTLRLVFCNKNSTPKIHWFCDREAELFRVRISTPQFPILVDGAVEVTNEDMKKFERRLKGKIQVDLIKIPKTSEIYKHRAEQRDMINDGLFAFVEKTEIINYNVQQFRKELEQKLTSPAILEKRKSLIESNLLLEQILLAIEARYEELEQQKSLEPDEHLSLRDLDSVARDSFPLCMRLLLHRLKNDDYRHGVHLKNDNRSQLGYFFHKAGLSESDALEVWQNFQSDDRKQILGNVRSYHKPANEYGCRKIYSGGDKISSANPVVGCPFGQNRQQVHALLANTAADIEDLVISENNKAEQSQSSCVKYFNLMHNSVNNNPQTQVFHRPSDYLKESRRRRRQSVNSQRSTTTGVSSSTSTASTSLRK